MAAANVFVCNFNASTPTVQVISPATWTVIHTITPGMIPVCCTVTPDGSKVLISGQAGGVAQVDVYDAVAFTFINSLTLPTHQVFVYAIAISSDNAYAYVSTQAAPGFDYYLAKCSLTTYALIASFNVTTSSTGSTTTNQMAITQDNNYLYFPGADFTVLVIATAGMTLFATVTTTRVADSCTALSRDGTLVFVSNTQTPGDIDVIQVSSNTEVYHYTQDATYDDALGVLADSTYLYITEQSQGTVGVFTLGTMSPQVAHISVGTTPSLMCITSDGLYLLVTNYGTGPPGTVSVITIATLTVLTTVTVQDNPFGIATAPFVASTEQIVMIL
jgi:YVTN family beta-propeller protein